MNDLIQIIRRELLERKMLILGALVIGVMILAVPIVTTVPAVDIWNVTSHFASIIFGTGASLFVGAGVIASDLREQRISFFLSRPVRAVSLWAGKMLSAWLTGLICAALVSLPVTLTGNGLIFWLTRSGDPGDSILVPALLILAAAPLGHAAGISLRARSPWLLLDFIAVALLIVLTWTTIRPFLFIGATDLMFMIMSFVAGLTVLVLLAAGCVSFIRGRSDLGTVHSNQSMIAGTSLITIGILAFLFGLWARSPDPDDVDDVWLIGCSSWECGPVFQGESPFRADYRPVFAKMKDRIIRLENANLASATPDGGRILWERIESIDPPTALIAYQDGGTTEPVITKISVQPYLTTSTMSPDGSRLAVVQKQLLQIYDLEGESVLHTIRLPSAAHWYRAWYLDDNRVLVITSRDPAGSRNTRSWIAVVARIQNGEIDEIPLDGFPFVYDPHRDLILTGQGDSIRGYSIDQGERVLSVEGADAIPAPQGVLVLGPERRTISVIDESNTELAHFELETAADSAVLGPVAGESVFVGLSHSGEFSRSQGLIPEDTELIRLDLETGEQRTVAKGLVPARAFTFQIGGPYFLRAGATRNELVHLDPATGETTVLAGRAD